MTSSELPLISVAICTYNGESFIKEQLESVANQTYPNLEIIICDDASVDQTYSILSSFKNQYNNVRIFRNETNFGFAKNFLKAIDLCQGEYIALCDQDDIWLKDKIEILYKNIGGNILIYSDSQFIDQNGTLINKKISEIRRPVVGKKPQAFLFHNSAPGHSILFNRKLLPYLKPFPENFFHDWWILYVANCVGSIGYTPKCLVQYRQHTKSETDILEKRGKIKQRDLHSKDRIEETRRLINHLNIFLKFPYNPPQVKKIISNLIKGYEDRINNSFFSFTLFFTLIANVSLFYIERKNVVQKLIFIIKESFGSKIKARFHYIKHLILKK